MKKFAIILLFILLSALYSNVQAEPFAGFYMGYNSPHASTIKDASGYALPDDAHKLKPGLDIGMRAGYWFTKEKAPYFGLFLDMSMDRSRIDAVWYPGIDIRKNSALLTFSFTANAALRYPYGRFRPYAGVGAGFIVADLDTDYAVLGATYYSDRNASTSTQWFVGAEIGLNDKIYMFFEYRRAKSNFEFKYDWKVKADYDTEQCLAGLGVKF